MKVSYNLFPVSSLRAVAAGFAAILFFVILGSVQLHAGIYMRVSVDDSVFLKGDSTVEGYKNFIVLDSFSFGLDRELTDAVKGGTSDLLTGAANLQEANVNKVLDRASTELARRLLLGTLIKKVEIFFTGADATKAPYLIVKMENAWVKSWSTSGDADGRPTEEVSFYFQKIAIGYSAPTDSKPATSSMTLMGWDRVLNKPWADTGIGSANFERPPGNTPD